MKNRHSPHDLELSVIIPQNNELKGTKLSKPRQSGSFRSEAAAVLEKEFKGHCWTIRESNTYDRLELKVAVRYDFIEAFRKRIAELGFIESESLKR